MPPEHRQCANGEAVSVPGAKARSIVLSHGLGIDPVTLLGLCAVEIAQQQPATDGKDHAQCVAKHFMAIKERH
ncbi:hypothetical protein ACIOWE_01070 [Pseudomonas sp. NPDC087598]|uniref:hypothetical protein n=1 Tax=Pseudomonas sp. NPDC087598 TaxID=3364440 RepID=UPI0038198A9E